jgi:hypothetical protein
MCEMNVFLFFLHPQTSTSHNLIGLHDLLQGQLYLFTSCLCGYTVGTNFREAFRSCAGLVCA